MKKLIGLILLCALLLATIATIAAQEVITENITKEELPETKLQAGITPDSWLYGLDRAFEKISLLFTIGHSAKAKKGLEHAAERLAEAREMIKKQKLKEAEKARREHAKILEKAKEEFVKIKKDPEKELETEIEIENEIEKHDDAILKIEREIEVKIMGNLTEEQQELVDKLLASLTNQTASIKIEIKTKKESTKIKIKEKGIDVNKTEEEIEKKLNIIEKRKERSAEQIEEARKEIEEVEEAIKETIEKKGINVSDVPAIEELLNNAKEKLENAEAAFEEEKYGMAFGQAVAAEKIARNIIRIIEAWEKLGVKWPCKPICMREETADEGWYDSCTEELIKKDECSRCEAICLMVGTRSEGWYSTCGRKLIIWTRCSSPAPPVCGNNICEKNEAVNCPQDCEEEIEKPKRPERPEKPKPECEKNEDCSSMICPMVIGGDTPQCKNGKCICGPKPTRTEITEIKEEIGMERVGKEELENSSIRGMK